MMERVSPIEMRDCLKLVQSFKEAGIGFIPIPYTTESEKDLLLKQMVDKVDSLEI